MDTTRARPAVRRTPAPLPTLRVLFTGGRPDGARVALRTGDTVLGRDPGEGLRLDGDPLLSRRHAAFHRGPSGVRLRDLESRNGTSLNGRPIDESALCDGDVVRVGDTFLLFRLEPAELPDAPVDGLLGDAPAIRAVRAALAAAAPTPATVLLQGETGAGKGAAARALHAGSRRAGPLVSVNCAAIPEQLAESTLFGHRAGAFTGAARDERGMFRAAEGGTLFLDEIGEMPPALQAKLLLAVEDRAVVPVGATSAVPVDTRILAATQVDLRQAVREGRFRADLYARLAEIVLVLPPLRDRREDVLPLLAATLPRHAPPLSPDLVEALLLHGWPFNVREVQKLATELAVHGAGRGLLEPSLLVGRLDGPPEPAREADGPPDREALEAALRAHGGIVTEVARAMGRSRKQVYRWLQRYELDPEHFRER